MKSELRKLFMLLSEKEYSTAYDLGKKLGISSKTVRTRLKELQNEGKKYGVRIEAKPSYGYRLVEEQEKGLDKMEKALAEATGFPDSIKERTDYILIYLLNHQGYTKIEELCEFLCVSKTTLQPALKEAESILMQYAITLERKPNYGICVRGLEFDIRRCLGEYFVKRNQLRSWPQICKEDEIEYLSERILELSEKYEIRLSENFYEELVIQVYLGVKRIKRGCLIQFEEKPKTGKWQAEWQMARELTKELEEWQQVHYSEEEICYIVIYLAGVRLVGNLDKGVSNFVIREELDSLVLKMLEFIYQEYGIDLRNNFNLRMMLNQHMVPFDIRIRYGIKIHNPILENIKRNYVFGYAMAEKSCSVLEQHYGKKVTEEELGYFAVMLVVALEEDYQQIRKNRILIVCSSRIGAARLLRCRYKQEFGKYLEKIYVCGLQDLANFDFKSVDYVFATIPVTQRVPVPIIEVRAFLEKSDVQKICQVLKKGPEDILGNYYKREQFWTGIEGTTKEEIIRRLCERIGKERKLPADFCEAVLKREELAPTAFGNRIAMPHPYRIMTKDTFIYVAVLEQEILWGVQPVQLVFLVSVGEQDVGNLPQFYETTISLFQQEELIEQIIREKDFDVMMEILWQIQDTE